MFNCCFRFAIGSLEALILLDRLISLVFFSDKHRVDALEENAHHENCPLAEGNWNLHVRVVGLLSLGLTITGAQSCHQAHDDPD